VLGFVGAPFTLATYIVEGGSSKNFAAIKRMAFAEPAVLHALLDKLADNVADYVRYQVGGQFTSLELQTVCPAFFLWVGLRP
jgi:uroporphyrinogen-III decarboxylase